MKVILFGATGMIGHGVLQECLLDPAITEVLAIGRNASGVQRPKLREILHRDFLDISSIAQEMSGFDACFFCLGVSSAGMTEARYRELTYDITLTAARTLASLNPGMTFIYVSAAGTDSSESSRIMWARVRGKTENDLLKLPFKAYAFRPAFVQPSHGLGSSKVWYKGLYKVLAPLLAWLPDAAPKLATTSARFGRAMIEVAKHGYPVKILESADINRATERGAHP